jgi:redox-sensitive bicupin YhaK (pirin superfamily)
MAEATAIELVIEPRPRDIGSFEVRRVLPHAKRRLVGPFIFFDHMGPATFAPGQGIEVRPHPHIGLATVTYLFDGAILHRDSLGSYQRIEPGAVNWMVAGRGIVHSERPPDFDPPREMSMEGIQTWIALPREHEDAEPSFSHHPASDLPRFSRDGVDYTVIAGTAFGERAPVRVFSPTLYVHAEAAAGAPIALPDEHAEKAVYVVRGGVEIEGRAIGPGQMSVLADGAMPDVVSRETSTVMLVGGAPLDGPRLIWWNLVSSTEDRIEAAKRRWSDGGFPKVPGDEEEFIPLPAN